MKRAPRPRRGLTIVVVAVGLLCVAGVSVSRAQSTPTDAHGRFAPGIAPWVRLENARDRLLGKGVSYCALASSQPVPTPKLPVEGGNACVAHSLVRASYADSTAHSPGYWELSDPRLLLEGSSGTSTVEEHLIAVVDARWLGPGPRLEQACPYSLLDDTGEAVVMGFVSVDAESMAVDDLGIPLAHRAANVWPGFPAAVAITCRYRY